MHEQQYISRIEAPNTTDPCISFLAMKNGRRKENLHKDDLKAHSAHEDKGLLLCADCSEARECPLYIDAEKLRPR